MKPGIAGPERIVVRKGRDLFLKCQRLSQSGVKFEVKWFKSQELVCLVFFFFSFQFASYISFLSQLFGLTIFENKMLQFINIKRLI
jgi:hypothetical protein